MNMLTIRDVSTRLGRAPGTVRRMIADGRLRAYRNRTNGRIGVPEEAVLDYETGVWLPIGEDEKKAAAVA